mmetsp:Transcript_138071/g.441097  ORF Transcript_138071/g.441097 Transcript_138071/m.441097 type:complete len:233 (+) Transcript_138071:1676-2374(+)
MRGARERKRKMKARPTWAYPDTALPATSPAFWHNPVKAKRMLKNARKYCIEAPNIAPLSRPEKWLSTAHSAASWQAPPCAGLCQGIHRDHQDDESYSAAAAWMSVPTWPSSSAASCASRRSPVTTARKNETSPKPRRARAQRATSSNSAASCSGPCCGFGCSRLPAPMLPRPAAMHLGLGWSPPQAAKAAVAAPEGQVHSEAKAAARSASSFATAAAAMCSACYQHAAGMPS